jgi:hypothetical protein
MRINVYGHEVAIAADLHAAVTRRFPQGETRQGIRLYTGSPPDGPGVLEPASAVTFWLPVDSLGRPKTAELRAVAGAMVTFCECVELRELPTADRVP